MTHDEDGKASIDGRLFNAPRKSADDYFLVFDREDPLHSSCCFGREEVRAVVSNYRRTKSVRVWRVTLDELSRDVTADFVSDDPVSIYAGDDPDRDHDNQRLVWTSIEASS